MSKPFILHCDFPQCSFMTHSNSGLVAHVMSEHTSVFVINPDGATKKIGNGTDGSIVTKYSEELKE